jgi:hypothetical protein
VRRGDRGPFAALPGSAPGDYAVDRGRVCSSGGLDLAPAEFGDHFGESQVANWTALVSTMGGQTYLTGPLARYSLSSDRLLPGVRAAAREAGLGPSCRILFAVDDDEVLAAAVPVVAAYARRWGANVRVLHVHRIDPAGGSGEVLAGR